MGHYRTRRSDMKLLLIAILLAAGPAAAQEKSEGNAVTRTAKKAGDATERTAKRAVGAVERGAKATDKALTSAAQKTENWVKEKTR
jgi:hypothetical protein